MQAQLEEIIRRFGADTGSAFYLSSQRFDTKRGYAPPFPQLDRVELPNPLWSLGNLGVRMPEPRVGALLLAGARPVCHA